MLYNGTTSKMIVKENLDSFKFKYIFLYNRVEKRFVCGKRVVLIGFACQALIWVKSKKQKAKGQK